MRQYLKQENLRDAPKKSFVSFNQLNSIVQQNQINKLKLSILIKKRKRERENERVISDEEKGYKQKVRDGGKYIERKGEKGVDI